MTSERGHGEPVEPYASKGLYALSFDGMDAPTQIMSWAIIKSGDCEVCNDITAAYLAINGSCSLSVTQRTKSQVGRKASLRS